MNMKRYKVFTQNIRTKGYLFLRYILWCRIKMNRKWRKKCKRKKTKAIKSNKVQV